MQEYMFRLYQYNTNHNSYLVTCPIANLVIPWWLNMGIWNTTHYRSLSKTHGILVRAFRPNQAR